MIQNGQKVKDLVTGFEGIVTGRVEYLTGCNQVLVTPRVKDGGDAIEARWFDEDRVEVTEAQPIRLPHTANGADKPAPVR
jgi:hypothetical protein